MSTLRVNTIQDSAGSGSPAINGLAKAWVNFNGTGTVAIRASLNVSSITDNGTGTYTVNFTNALSDSNYVVAVSTGGAWTGSFHVVGFVNDGSQDFGGWNPAAPSTTRFDITLAGTANGGSRADNLRTHVAVFR
jgi:hypothetical protein